MSVMKPLQLPGGFTGLHHSLGFSAYVKDIEDRLVFVW